MRLNIDLPWPPTINHYWRHTRHGIFLSQRGKDYREQVCYLCLQSQGFFDENTRLSVSILAYPPDRRKRDLDNVLKSLLDALMHAGVYSDDSQIDKLTISRNKPLDGRVIVSIDTLSEEGIKNN